MFQQLFDGHPDLMVYPTDLAILYAYFPEYTEHAYTRNERKDRLRTVVFRDWEQKRSTDGWRSNLPLEAYERRFFDRLEQNETNLAVIEDVLEQLVLAYRDTCVQTSNNGSYCVLKETSQEIYAERLLNAFPGSKFLHLVRDPRDNFGALKSGLTDRYGDFGDTAKTVMASMLYRYRTGIKLGKAHATHYDDRYSFIRFEDVTGDTERTMREITDFIDVAFHEQLLRPTVLGNPTGGNSFDDVEFTGVSTKHVGKWPDRITEEEAALIEGYFEEFMTEFDYDLQCPERERSRAAVEFYKWANYEYFYYDRFQDLPSP